jgi:hypothetical protein
MPRLFGPFGGLALSVVLYVIIIIIIIIIIIEALFRRFHQSPTSIVTQALFFNDVITQRRSRPRHCDVAADVQFTINVPMNGRASVRIGAQTVVQSAYGQRHGGGLKDRIRHAASVFQRVCIGDTIRYDA